MFIALLHYSKGKYLPQGIFGEWLGEAFYGVWACAGWFWGEYQEAKVGSGLAAVRKNGKFKAWMIQLGILKIFIWGVGGRMQD